ncbi:MAG: GLUG motif-containing protein [Methylococcales bacterium]
MPDVNDIFMRKPWQTTIAQGATISAKTLNSGKAGTIKVLTNMDSGIVNVAGKLDASAPKSGDGGFIDTSAANVNIADTAKISTLANNGKTGTWLIDPVDFTITAGAAPQTIAGIGATTLSTNLGLTNVNITTDPTTAGNGDIFVNAAVNWSANLLTLTALRDININAPLNASGTGSLTLNAVGTVTTPSAVSVNGIFTLASGTWNEVNASLPSFYAKDFRINTGSTFIRALSGTGASGSPYQLADVYGLQGMGSDGMLGNYYTLGANIDASVTSIWNTGDGFMPVGTGITSASFFTGSFDGLGHTITGLTINRPTTDWVGLFGATQYGIISNVGMVDGNVRGSNNVGGLVGQSSSNIINNAYATSSVNGVNYVGGLVGSEGGPTGFTINNAYAMGSVTGNTYVGGLVGYSFNWVGSTNNAYATGSVTGDTYVGGLVGFNPYGVISNAYATGSVTGTSNVGGLVGVSGRGFNVNDSAINNAYATGSVTGDTYVGGLVGGNNSSTITNAYATGSVSGGSCAGGLVGDNYSSTITNAYATGSVSGGSDVGGLVGLNDGSSIINNAYAMGSVTGNGAVGGLVGYNSGSGSINNAYATGNVSGTSYNVGGLVGVNYGSNVSYGSINNAYATGSVTGTSTVGGLVGANMSGYINNAYATGSVTGTDAVGGLVGHLKSTTINNAYATGSITGTSTVGGLVGWITNGTIENAFWDVQNTSQSTGVGVSWIRTVGITSKTTAEMQQIATFSNAGWSIANTGGSSAVWRIYEGTTSPLLRSFLTPLTVTADNISKTYNGLSDATLVASYSIANAPTSGHLFDLINPYNSAVNVGNYIVTRLYSDQQGYDISLNNGLLTINPAPLTITANDASKTYGQTLNFAGTEFLSSGLVNGESIGTVALSSNGANATASVKGSPYVISASNATGGTFNANNYSITYNNGELKINRAPLSIIANNDIKFFNGSAYQGGNGVFYFGLVNNETSQNLAGILSYGGSSQGAINLGRYVITPMGFDSDNYQITYLSGTLNIVPSFIPPYVPPNPIPITLSGINDNSSSVDAKVSVNEVSDDFTISNSSSEKINRTIIPTLSMKNSAGKVKRLKMNANKQFLSLLMEDGSVRVWDFQRGVQRSIVASNKNQALTDISTVNNEGELLSVASNFGIGAYDIIGWLLDDKLAIKESDVKHFVSSDDGNLLLVDIGAGDLSLWDHQQKKLLWQIPYQRGTVNNLALTNDKHYAAVLSREVGVYSYDQTVGKLKPITDALDIIDLATGKIVKSLPNLGEDVIYSRFKDNDTLSIGLATGELSDWSISTGSKKPVAHFSETIVAVDHDKDTYAYIAENGAVRIGNAQGDIQLSIQNKGNPITDAKLLAGGKKLLTVLDSGDLALWDVASGKKILRLFSTQQGWTVMDAFGRFDGSDEAMENFNWIADEEKIPLDSFSENYYEPGLLSNILNDQDNLNNDLDAVRDGITLPPKVEMQLAAQQDKSDKVALQLDIYDRGGGINKVRLYHNGKLISNEDSVIATQTMQEDNAEHRVLNINVTPSAGKNTLKVVASNTAGIENSSSEINFDGKTKAYQSSVRLMTVGINHYKERKFHLNYTVADAELIGETIKNNSNLIASKNLTNEHATKPHILADLKELSQGVQQDVLVIYFAGHGLALGKEWYFLPYETELQPTPEQIADYGITATELSDIFKDSKIQHILLMVDACYSGAGLDAFSKLENGQRYLTRRLGRSLGITVITAATKDQAAMELKSLGHGLFTYLISQEIANKESDKSITAHGIAENIAKTLPKLSKEMLGSSQEPTAYTRGDDFMLTNLGDNKK